MSTSAAAAAHAALAGHLSEVLRQLEPETLGLYWAVHSEFNAVQALAADAVAASCAWALPFALRTPREMHFRAWDRQPSEVIDECGLRSASGAMVTPDVVLVPCLGYTPSSYRLGYGGGYYDRWLAAHPQATAIGVAWSLGELDDATFAAQPHDRPMMLVVTERGVVSA